MHPDPIPVVRPDELRRASPHALTISLGVLGLFYYWFAVADRYQVFLYGHLGATPFDEVTSSRYWMAGLVAAGMVMVGYSLANWLLGRIFRLTYRPPKWWHVWALCVPVVAMGIPLITMNLNRPTLPLGNATACMAITLVGLALALVPGSMAAQRPVDLFWLALDGWGLMPALLLLRAVELPSKGLVGAGTAYSAAIGGTLMGAAWLGVMTGLRAWQRKSGPGAGPLLVAGLCLSYLLMPLAHYLLETPPGYRYISTASNFFAFNLEVQLLALAVAVSLALGITQLRKKLPLRPFVSSPHPGENLG